MFVQQRYPAGGWRGLSKMENSDLYQQFRPFKGAVAILYELRAGDLRKFFKDFLDGPADMWGKDGIT